MHPSVHAASSPDKPAVIVAETGETVSYAELDAASNRAAQLFRSHGLKHDDVVAFMLENTPHYYGLTWGAQRAGLRYVCISSRLTQDETDYILENSGAKMLVVSASLASAALQLETRIERYSMGGEIAGWTRIEDALAAMPATRIADERAGVDMLYSSGTTGRPKGVKVPLPEEEEIDAPNSLVMLASAAFGINADSIYLSPAPLYHAAPLRWSMTIHRLGGTVVLMKKFDPEAALAAIQHYRCNAAQFVPTHFVRMLKLPAEVRAQYDVSSMKSAIHAAAPCPVPVKQAMIDWWGPIIHEYYSGTEACGITALSAGEWLAKPGSVGKAILGIVKIVDDDGNELPVGQIGNVYFADGPRFEYHNDPAKTAAAYDHRGWATLGDIGRLDGDGYLYLTDRKNFMIISGGVNIYPQEIENSLIEHPFVADCAVFGLPDAEMGQVVVAVVQPSEAADESLLATTLTAFLRERLGGVKVPRIFHFRPILPREPTGKLLKHKLVREYLDVAEKAGA